MEYLFSKVSGFAEGLETEAFFDEDHLIFNINELVHWDIRFLDTQSHNPSYTGRLVVGKEWKFHKLLTWKKKSHISIFSSLGGLDYVKNIMENNSQWFQHLF